MTEHTVGVILRIVFIGLVLSAAVAYPNASGRTGSKKEFQWDGQMLRRFLRALPFSLLASILLVTLDEKHTHWKWGDYLENLMKPLRPQLWICMFVIGVGFGAHRWKRKSKFTYGVGEAIFGSLAAIFIVFRTGTTLSLLSQWIGLGGAAYIIARGLNNAVEAKEESTESREIHQAQNKSPAPALHHE